MTIKNAFLSGMHTEVWNAFSRITSCSLNTRQNYFYLLKMRSQKLQHRNIRKSKDLELLRISICTYLYKWKFLINPGKGQGWTWLCACMLTAQEHSRNFTFSQRYACIRIWNDKLNLLVSSQKKMCWVQLVDAQSWVTYSIPEMQLCGIKPAAYQIMKSSWSCSSC